MKDVLIVGLGIPRDARDAREAMYAEVSRGYRCRREEEKKRRREEDLRSGKCLYLKGDY